MPRYDQPRRKYREPPRTRARGSAFVFVLGILLMLAAAGGYYLVRSGYLVAGDDASEVAVLPVAEVCAAATEANTKYPQQLTTLIQAGVEKVLAGDTAGGDKATADAVALAKEWTGDLRASATQTDDAALRTAITDLADKLAPAEAGTMSLNDMGAIVEDGTKAIAAKCPTP